MANLTVVDDLTKTLEKMGPAIEKAMPPGGMKLERFIQLCRNALIRAPAIAECTRASIFDSVMRAAELGLDPSGQLGSAYLMPFKGVCTFVPGYRGLIDLAVRSGEVLGIKAEVVYWGDEFDVEEGDRPRLYHKPMMPKTPEEQREQMNAPREVRAAYAVATLNNKTKQFCVMSFRDLEAVRLRAPGGRSDKTPWFTDRPEMYKKCPIRRITKQLPLSPLKASLLQQALAIEDDFESEHRDDPETRDVNNPPPLSATERLMHALAPTDAEIVGEPPPDVPLPSPKK